MLPDNGRRPKHVGGYFEVLLTVHFSIFISGTSGIITPIVLMIPEAV